MADLGINVAGHAEQQPADIAALGATWVRCVGYPDTNIAPWMQGCHARCVKVLMVLASESIGQNASFWAENIVTFRARYGSLVDAWQLGNESDHVSPSSWTMTQDALSELLLIGRNVLGPDAHLIGPGLVSGQPDWAASVDWGPVQAIACHPYAKRPNTPELSSLIAGYAAYGKPLWVTEYNARTLGMAAALRSDARLSTVLAFCYSDSMVPGFGLIEDKTALLDFKAAAKAGAPPPGVPTVPTYDYQFGIKAKAEALKAAGFDPGRALEPETYPYPNSPYSYQMAERGLFVYSKVANTVQFYPAKEAA